MLAQQNHTTMMLHLRQWGGAGQHELFSLRPIKKHYSRSNARSDHAVLELFCFFFLSMPVAQGAKKKVRQATICKRLHLNCLPSKQHPKQIYCS